MSEGGRIKGAMNVKKFENFIELHDKINDWNKYVNPSKKKLRRRIISQECGFGNSAFSQNPLLSKMLNLLEDELVRKGILQVSNEQLKAFEYESQMEFIDSYTEKIFRFKTQVGDLTKKLNFYQSELEKFK